MSAYDQNRAVPLGAVTLFRITNFFEQVGDALRSRQDARATIRELSALSDQRLQDVGVERGEIEDLAYVLARRSR